MKRREFFKTVLATVPTMGVFALFSSDAKALTGFTCSEDFQGACFDGDLTTKIGTNHPFGLHKLMIPKEDIEKGAAKQYSIQGDSGHPHTVKVTEQDFIQLQLGNVVSVTSSTDGLGEGHNHVVKVVCL